MEKDSLVLWLVVDEMFVDRFGMGGGVGVSSVAGVKAAAKKTSRDSQKESGESGESRSSEAAEQQTRRTTSRSFFGTWATRSSGLKVLWGGGGGGAWAEGREGWWPLRNALRPSSSFRSCDEKEGFS